MAIAALERRDEIEFLKIMAMINGMIYVGNQIASAVVKAVGGQTNDSGSADGLNKSIEAVKKSLLPHLAEMVEHRAEAARAKILEEVSRGPMQIKVVGQDKKQKGRIRMRRKDA